MPGPTVVHLTRLLPAVLLLAAPARGDKTDDAIAKLRDKQDGVRVAAASVLAQLGDKRAVPALVEALKDDSPIVRGVAAAALGKLGDPSAVPALKKAEWDGNGFVREKAKGALALLGPLAPAALGAGPGGTAADAGAATRYFVELGAFADQSGTNGTAVRDAARDTMQATIDATGGEIATRWDGGRKPKPAELMTRGVRGFFVDGTVRSLSRQNVGAMVQVDCEVKMIVGSWPERSIKSWITQAAGVQNDRRYFKPEQEPEMRREACAEAVRLAAQEQLFPFLRGQAP
jgi:hypothetical protein